MGKLHGRQLTVNMCVSTAQVLTRMSTSSLPIEITGYQVKFAAASYIGVHAHGVCIQCECVYRSRAYTWQPVHGGNSAPKEPQDAQVLLRREGGP